MKKLACVLLALAMLFALASVALADSASYADGQLTISVTTPDYYSIWIDGKTAGAYMTETETSKTIAKTLSDGVHTVELSSASKTITLTVKVGSTETEEPTAAPTTAPTTEPTAAPTTAPDPTVGPVGALAITSASYDAVTETLTFEVSGLTTYGETWIDGHSSTKTATNGTNSIKLKGLAEGTYTVTVHNPDTGATVSKSFTVKYAAPVINSASYTKVGTLNYSVSDITNECEVWVDGGTAHTSVTTNGAHTLAITLKEGAHTLTVHNPFNGKTANYSFTVDHIWNETAAKEATCTADGNTEGKVCEICGKVEKELVVIPALGHDIIIDAGVEATCTKTGLTEGQHCSRCGEATIAQTVIPALGHHYIIKERTVSKVYYECTRCGDSFTDENTKAMKNAYGAIVYDANMVGVDYTAKLDKKVVVITADLTSKAGLTTELGLYLSEDLIAQLKKDGITAVNFVNGNATIVIELAEIKPEWFADGTTIWNYVFSTDPAAEGGILVKVEAQVSGTEKVPADAFTGVTLKKADGDVAVTANGIY